MEIKYSNYKTNPDIFEENSLVSLIDEEGKYLSNNLYDIKEIQIPKSKTVRQFLNIGLIPFKEGLAETLLKDFEISKEILNEKMSNLSNGNLIKIYIIALCIDNSSTIILDHIDMSLNNRDLKNILTTLSTHEKEIRKSIIYCPNKLENATSYTKRFILIENDVVKYIGNDYLKLEIKTEIMEFVDSANKRGAKLDYYKEPNDLLKAIYRSVEK